MASGQPWTSTLSASSNNLSIYLEKYYKLTLEIGKICFFFFICQTYFIGKSAISSLWQIWYETFDKEKIISWIESYS